MTPGPEAMPMTDTEKRMAEARMWDYANNIPMSRIEEHNAVVAALRAALAEVTRHQVLLAYCYERAEANIVRAEAAEAREEQVNVKLRDMTAGFKATNEILDRAEAREAAARDELVECSAILGALHKWISLGMHKAMDTGGPTQELILSDIKARLASLAALGSPHE